MQGPLRRASQTSCACDPSADSNAEGEMEMQHF